MPLLVLHMGHVLGCHRMDGGTKVIKRRQRLTYRESDQSRHEVSEGSEV